ncbi:hypothetical protein E2C01_009177 [Portunus trituberculatus]|uniref:Uncharacterized protein n=1 Tax=Portunus trituberculatus TaxID=210409 RepID=A0A5B7D5B1_PORTR|nr:hypothetical protein [Portunus trituberculatus]
MKNSCSGGNAAGPHTTSQMSWGLISSCMEYSLQLNEILVSSLVIHNMTTLRTLTPNRFSK